MYPREPFTKAEGDSLSLSCMVKFQRKSCKEIQTKWCFFRTPDNCEPIIDPHRYIIHVNETEDIDYRLRRIFITFNSVRHQDSGYYQCNAKCESGTEAKGHLVHLNVTGLSLFFLFLNWRFHAFVLYAIMWIKSYYCLFLYTKVPMSQNGAASTRWTQLWLHWVSSYFSEVN